MEIESIVTAVETNGFYLQSTVGDDATSEGMFVFTRTAPGVRVGDGITVRGIMGEFQGGPTGLSVTQTVLPAVTVGSVGNCLPLAVLIGKGGRRRRPRRWTTTD